MRIGILGSGHIGSTLAGRFVEAGHHVAIANSRGPETIGDLVGRIGSAATAATVDDAIGYGDVVVVAIPFGRYEELPADGFRNLTVIDTMNYYPQRDGRWPELDEGRTTSSELLAAQLPAARVVKAFNTIPAAVLRDGARPVGDPQRLAVPVAGDDDNAKLLVMGLIDKIGFDPVDSGPLGNGGRRQQPGTPIYGAPVDRTETERLLRSVR